VLQIRSWLQELYETQRRRPDLFQEIVHSVSLRGAQTAARHRKLMRFDGPDQDTLEMLTANAARWYRDPESFWYSDSFPSRLYADPGARVVGLFLDVGGLDV